MDPRRFTTLVLSITCACLGSAATGCDLADPDDPWSTPTVPTGLAQSRAAQSSNGGSETVEIFRTSSTRDFIANTAASTNPILAPAPAGIVPLDEPELSDGFMLAFKVYDEDDQLVGFGTKQEILDTASATGISTYTLTLPGRGTLLLEETEDVAPLLAELGDMIADGELVRGFDPPLEVVTTRSGAGRVLGGTGEFAGVHGTMEELVIVHEFDLIARTYDIDDVLEVVLEHGDEDEDEDE